MERLRFRPGVGWGLLGVLLLLGVGFARAESDRPVLIRVPLEGPDQLYRVPLFTSANAAPARILEESALVWGTEETTVALRDAGFEAEPIGRKRADRTYLIVSTDPRADPGGAPLSAFGEVLWRSANTAVLAGMSGAVDSLAGRFDLIAIPERSIPAAPETKRTAPAAPAQVDSAVFHFVHGVDADSLRRTAQDLEEFGDRRSDAGGCHDAGEYLLERFRRFGIDDVTRFDYAPWSWCDNVVAVQPGLIAPGQIVVICGHYDSISRAGPAPGADDNASGTAGVVEAARLFARHEFEATIVYLAFGGEEQGLYGSEAWASHAREQGLDIRAAINLDMLGYLPPGTSGDLDLIGGGPRPDLRELAFATIPLYLPDHPLDHGFLSSGSSDHQSFWDNGYPALFLHEDTGYRNPFYHTSNDRIGPSLNDFDFLRRNVQAAVALVATLARPLRVRITHEPIDDPSLRARSYRIAARIESVAPLWEDSLFVHYSVDAGPDRRVPLRPSGGAMRYEAELPPQPAGSIVAYHLYAQDVEGRTAFDPPLAPAERNRFRVGLATRFYDDFEGEDPGWIVGAAGDDATSGIWERGVPVGTGPQPSTDAQSPTGGTCFFTANGPPGGDAGAADVDGGRTSLTS
ncbi:MAG: M28 family peptidase, partial [Candidatus Eisenbacteria bacterium]|nr:M28 family peptidase [Candidatus Latescibacterota bacterium]MBD3301265.1 M28 family peptidase [Candidatus Eisenbacteria bacterium]